MWSNIQLWKYGWFRHGIKTKLPACACSHQCFEKWKWHSESESDLGRGRQWLTSWAYPLGCFEKWKWYGETKVTWTLDRRFGWQLLTSWACCLGCSERPQGFPPSVRSCLDNSSSYFPFSWFTRVRVILSIFQQLSWSLISYSSPNSST